MINTAFYPLAHQARKAAFPALLLLMSWNGHAFAANCTDSYTYTDNGSSSSYTLNTGDSLKIASGNYTGFLDSFTTGSSICVETGATFTPVNINNAAGTLINHGVTNLQTFSYNTGTVIDNYGTLNFTAGLNTSGTTTFRNRSGATMSMANSFQLGNNSTFINDGLVVAQQDFNTQDGTILTNNYRLELEGNFNPDGKFDNYGRVYARKFMNIDAHSDVSNYCTLVSHDGFNNNSPLMDNQGTILITTATGAPGGLWHNNQAFTNGSSAKIAGGDFINDSTFTGGGFMIFSGDTRNQGAFNGNSSADNITFYDETQTGTQLFDVIDITPTNTVRTAFARPTVIDAPLTCTVSYKNFTSTAAYDYGDAPATYGEAGHIITSGIHLGANVPDVESAYQASADADGDDGNGADDEDGIASFPLLTQGNTSYTIPAANISVTNTTGGDATLYGFIDFNGDGDFADTGENASVAVANGAVHPSADLSFSGFPAVPSITNTFARFRLSTDAGLDATATASNGEVEDHRITINTASIKPSNDVMAYANSGSGLYKNEIAWLNWSNSSLANGIHDGDQVTFPLTCGNGTLTVTFSNIVNPTGAATYKPADMNTYSLASGWQAYNTPNLGEAIYASANAPSPYTAYDFTAQIDFTMTREGQNVLPDLILIDAESTSKVETSLEKVNATTNGGAWNIIENAGGSGYDITGTGTQSISITNTQTPSSGPILLTENASRLTVSLDAHGKQGFALGILLPCDRGDAPGFGNPTHSFGMEAANSPGTPAAPAGLRNVPAQLHLGTAEPDAEATLTADDNAQGLRPADEDGISSFPTLFSGVTSYTIPAANISVTNPTGGNATLYGFIDFNGDGDFADTGEQASVTVANGAVNPSADLSFSGFPAVPSIASTFARFRLSTDAGLDATNVASNGEVEDYPLSITTVIPTGTISGTVYQDNNGDNSYDSGTETGLAAITVNLRNDANGAVIATTNTAADGSYTFTTVDTSLTYRIEADTADPDLPAGVVIGTGNPLIGVTVSPGGTTTNQDFGFDQTCFLVVTTTADSDSSSNTSGSLRDAIECANSTPGADTISFNIPKTESGFMNPDGLANNGDEYWRITLNSQLPAITESVSIDGSTQTLNQGNTNNGDIAAATIVGTNNISLSAVNAPEVEILGQTTFPAGFDIKSGNVGIYALGIRRFATDILVSEANSNGILLVGLAMGVNAVSGNDPGVGERSNQHIAVDASGTSVIVANNIFGYNNTLRSIVTGQNSTLSNVNLTVSGNHFIGTGMAGNTDNGAIEILRTQNPGILISGNRFSGRGSATASDFAIEFNDGGSTDTSCSNCRINNNDISGYHDGIGYQGSAKITGLEITNNRIRDNTATAIIMANAQDSVMAENQLYNNGESAVVISHPDASGNIITRNRIYDNGALGIDLVGGNENPSGITLNDANDTDTGPNDLLNFPPMLQIVKSSTGNIIIRGCAVPGAVVELFEADVSPGGAASTGDNRFGLSDDYGEGQTYLASMAEGGAADMDSGSCSIPDKDGNVHSGMNAFQFSIATPASVIVGDYLTATATLAGSGTSEFSPTIRVDDAPPSVGGGDCAATGGSDILFIVDNSGSITTAEYTDFQQTIQKVGSQLLADNPANRIAIAHFGGPSDTLISGGQYVYFERDFSSNPMTAPIRKFGTAGTFNTSWYADHLAGALQQIRYGLDGNPATTSSYIRSPIKETTRNLATPLQIVLMTDAARYYDGTPWDISMLIDPSGSGAEPNDSSNFTVYNELKTEGVSFSVVSFNPNPVDIAASAAIASVGGAYAGNVEANPSDPEGSQTKPRRYVSVTSGFQLTSDQIIEISDGTAICNSAISGTIFEDVNYGGGAGRPFGTAGTVGVMGASVEFYDNKGTYLGTVVSSASGSYRFNLPDADYYVRVVSNTVNSSRSGSNGSEIPILTYRSDGVTATTNEIGGRNPSAPTAGSNAGTSTLNTSTFAFSGGVLAGKQAHAVQRISLTGDSIKNANFGFNFDTIVNANDSDYGSLRQFLMNANLLGDDTSLTQAGKPAGKENAILMLLTSDPNYTGQYWSIPLQSVLPTITSPITLDSSQQAGFTGTPLLELNGLGAGFAANGLSLGTGSDTSNIRNLAINRFTGNGIQVTNSNAHTIQGNQIGTSPNGAATLGNSRTGIMLVNASNNLIGGTDPADTNRIAHNGFDGIAITGDSSQTNSLLGNSIFDNGGLGIDLADNGVTSNDADDADSGPNALLNYPLAEDNAFAANGTRIVTYDLDLDVPVGEYRLELFGSNTADPSGNGEGQIFLGYKDLVHPGLGSVNYKGTLNANQAVASGTFISSTLTRKTITNSFAETSEFSGIKDSIPAVVCDNLISGTGGDIMIDENSPVITLLEATDGYGNPVSYVISGGTDSSMFTVKAASPGATINCTAIEFINPTITKSQSTTRAVVPPGYLPAGNYEIPEDADDDNVYELQITAKYADGKQYTRDLSVRIMDINEAPRILSGSAISVAEDTTATAVNIIAVDEDEGSVEDKGISYSISGGVDASLFTIGTDSGILSFQTIPDYDAPIDSNKDNIYTVDVTASDSEGLSATRTFSITVTNRTTDDGVKLNVRAMLQGAYDSSSGLMGNELAVLSLLPPGQPYGAAPFNHAGTETLGTVPMSATGNDAIVDWILVDIRTSKTDIVSSRAVLLQRDGDMVDAQSGSPTLHFAGVSPGNYYVSTRHRNHLAAITASPRSLGNTETLVDFSLSATAVNGEETRYTSGSLALLWIGDIDGNGTITNSGPGNDITSMLSSVITSAGNPNAYTNYSLPGYMASDLNMDGKTLFSGPNNDANTLIGNVIMHPSNSNFAANYIVRGGL